MATPILQTRIPSGRGQNDHDEVWDGVLVMAPIANNEHQRLGTKISHVIESIIEASPGVLVFAGTNVSDRDEGWLQNFRIPDVAVYCPGNPARDADTHWVGGPDLAVEILSKGDRARDKAPFYGKVGVRELLIIDRDPWTLELYRGDGTTMTRAETARIGEGVIRLQTVPLAIWLAKGEARPTLEFEHPGDGRRWSV